MKTLAQNLRFSKGQIPKEIAEFFEPAGCGKCYTCTMVEVFREVRRVLHDSGTVWLNVGDSYNNFRVSSQGQSVHDREMRDKPEGRRKVDRNLKDKDLCLIPWRLAIALQADGWWLRSVICWHKKSCMPESVTDRPTNSWEPIFLLAKSAKYFYDATAVAEPCADSTMNDGRLRDDYEPPRPERGFTGSPSKGSGLIKPNGGMRSQRNVWHLGPEPYAEAHFATFPTEIPRRAILAGTSARGCCPKCYAPWVRVVEKGPPAPEPAHRNPTKRLEPGQAGNADAGNMGFRASKLSGQEMSKWKAENPDRTVGWEPGCECGEQPIPQTVLDPFGGSGTSGAVANELGRHAILCELSPEYAKLIETRTQNGMGLALH